MGENGRAQSANAPSRPQETAASAIGVATRTASAAAAARLPRAEIAACANGSESAPDTIAKRAIGRKSASTAPRKVKYAAGIQASATSSHPGSRCRSAL
jgi:hypothetical protein